MRTSSKRTSGAMYSGVPQLLSHCMLDTSTRLKPKSHSFRSGRKPPPCSSMLSNCTQQGMKMGQKSIDLVCTRGTQSAVAAVRTSKTLLLIVIGSGHESDKQQEAGAQREARRSSTLTSRLAMPSKWQYSTATSSCCNSHRVSASGMPRCCVGIPPRRSRQQSDSRTVNHTCLQCRCRRASRHSYSREFEHQRGLNSATIQISNSSGLLQHDGR